MTTAFKISSFVMLLLAFAACTNKALGTKTTATKAQTVPTIKGATFTTYQMDNGTLNWTGSKAIGSAHLGTINISKGTLGLSTDGQIATGDFTIDMASITCTDLQVGQGKEKLEGHLKAKDFFDVAQFPIGAFEILKVELVTGVPAVTHNITGNLTLKGVKKSITIPANIAMAGGCLLYTSPSPRDRG